MWFMSSLTLHDKLFVAVECHLHHQDRADMRAILFAYAAHPQPAPFAISIRDRLHVRTQILRHARFFVYKIFSSANNLFF